MLDVRRLIRGMALQLLYELDTTTHPAESIFRFRGSVELQENDVHLVGYVALCWCYENMLENPITETFDLPINLPIEQRTAVQHVLIDYLTEDIDEENLTDDLSAEIEHEIIQPDTEEFDVLLQKPPQMLELDEQRHLHRLIRGVLVNRELLDRIIHRYATEYPPDQLAVIDRNILRIAIFEYGISRGTPLRVAINEAVELASIYGSDSSTRFVNGVLGSVADHHEEIQTELQDMATNYHNALEGA